MKEIELKCPCGAPAVSKMWEAPVYLCREHMMAWLRSPEKLRCTEGEMSGEPGGGPGDPAIAASEAEIQRAVDDFVARISPPTFWARVKRWFRRWVMLLGERVWP